MLRISGLHVNYGFIRAVQGVSIHVPEGSITTIVGANGAGKSTIIRSIMGLVRPAQGSIRLAGKEELVGRRPHEISRAGVGLVPEGRGILAQMTVWENMRMGLYGRKDKDINRRIDTVTEQFPILRERRDQPAGLLSGGEQQMLAIARALMGEPKLLLLDEPSLGLAPLLVNRIFDIIRDINAAGTTILLVEQNARKALTISDTAYVLETGRIVKEGPAQTLRHDPDVAAAYLGGVSA